MLELFKYITTFVFDVDGVLTDGTLLVMPNSLLARRMHIKDGYALQLAIKKGYRVIVISGGNAPEVKERLQKLGVTEVHMQATDKQALLSAYMLEHRLEKEEVLFMGDDIPDLAAMASAGLPCCPADAVTEIRNRSVYISSVKGGEGCVRDVVEKVMKLRGDWHEDTSVPSR